MRKLLLALVSASLVLAGCNNPSPKEAEGSVLAELPSVQGKNLVTHGSDPIPPPKPGEAPRLTREVPWPCVGNGAEGPRIEFLYAHGVGATSLDSLKPTFEAYARKIQGAFLTSAQETGGYRLLRYTTDANCQLVIHDVTVSANALASFDTMITELDTQGFNKQDRKYHMWVEANSYCGIGTVYEDDKASNTNINNTGPSYARSDRNCWNYAEAHEIMHNLGGVQNSAPNSTGGLHSRDEYDIMSYADGGPTGQIVIKCPNKASEDLFDCNHDDYFTTVSNLYLDTHWNTADSSWLETNPPAIPTTTLPSTTTTSSTIPTTTTTVVGSGETTTQVTYPTPVRVGVNHTFTAKVTGGCNPGGVVAWYVSGKLLTKKVIAGNISVASFRFSDTGRYTVRAVYEGSTECKKSQDSVRPTVR